MGLKVANVPLVLEVPPPKELVPSASVSSGQDKNSLDSNMTIDPNRVFCLTIAPSELKRIRTTRLERSQVSSMQEKKYGFESGSALRSNSNIGDRRSIESFRTNGETPKSKYNDRTYLMNDLRNARDLAMKHNWTQIDVTGRAVEETASLISELMNERFENDIFNI